MSRKEISIELGGRTIRVSLETDEETDLTSEQRTALNHWRKYVRERTNDLLQLLGGDFYDDVDIFSQFKEEGLSGISGQSIREELERVGLLTVQREGSDIDITPHERLTQEVKRLLQGSPNCPENAGILAGDIVDHFARYTEHSISAGKHSES